MLEDSQHSIDDFSPVPPNADRVAARAMVLAAVACRGMTETNVHQPAAEELRCKVLHWIEGLGITEELEPREEVLLSTPLGQLDKEKALNAGWLAEGLVVLAWALGSARLPSFEEQCDPPEVANALGFLDSRENTVLHRPYLRDFHEIERQSDLYLTLHWRLRQQSCEPGPMDFVDYVSKCSWGPLRLEGLELRDNDLAIAGVRIDKVEFTKFRDVLSITQERHQALNWLLGLDPIYSQVTTDT